VVRSVLQLSFCVQFILLDPDFTSGVISRWVHLWRQLGQINLKDGIAESWPLACLTSGKVLVSLLGDQVLDVFVFFLNNLIARQVYELVFVKDLIEQCDHSTHVVQHRCVVGHSCVLFSVEELELHIVD